MRLMTDAHDRTPMRILLVSTPVGPLGSGIGGGVELTLHSLVYGLGALGHHVEVMAPAGSLHVGARVHQVEGALQVSSQTLGRDEPVQLPASSVLAAMWNRVADIQDDFDVVVNLAYDWLPLFLTRFFQVPVVHFISMGSLNNAMDLAIREVADLYPDRLGVHSVAQAATFSSNSPLPLRVLANGIVTDRYDVHVSADEPRYLGSVGRISPEKGLEDVAQLSARTGMKVKVWGMMQDSTYWQRIVEDHPNAHIEYCGFLPTDELQEAIGGCTALIMTHKWVEAFGNVAIEAMATGVPVITYDRGGPTEIVVDGETGFIVAADDVDALVGAVERIDSIERIMCRQRVEEEYSAEALAGRFERWLETVVAAARTSHG
jgi:UDP-glucose:tetrahydrobiopterin glucosyltransferase